AGVAWGIYSMRGQNAGNPIHKTGGNFLRAVPLSLVVSLLYYHQMSLDGIGIGLAAASGGLTSGVGYAIWYTVLPALQTTSAATVQLCVPVLATFGGVMLLSEPITLRLMVSSLAVLGGLALFILSRDRSRGAKASATN
ncbi:MAG: DMT family transporter, partial [Cyanobacteria bacterium P01_E01_bin.34]